MCYISGGYDCVLNLESVDGVVAKFESISNFEELKKRHDLLEFDLEYVNKNWFDFYFRAGDFEYKPPLIRIIRNSVLFKGSENCYIFDKKRGRILVKVECFRFVW